MKARSDSTEEDSDWRLAPASESELINPTYLEHIVKFTLGLTFRARAFKLQDFIEFREKCDKGGQTCGQSGRGGGSLSAEKCTENCAEKCTFHEFFHESCLQSSCEVSSSSGHVEVTY